MEHLCLEALQHDPASAKKDQRELGCFLNIVEVQLSQSWLLGELG